MKNDAKELTAADILRLSDYVWPLHPFDCAHDIPLDTVPQLCAGCGVHLKEGRPGSLFPYYGISPAKLVLK